MDGEEEVLYKGEWIRRREKRWIQRQKIIVVVIDFCITAAVKLDLKKKNLIFFLECNVAL